MHLKSITLLGFKSFADKTSLTFKPGITAVVGPNGCGKSNVADAIRWVLGEQSAKALRGGEMADVIFNGTDGRKALGMAEVSLTISDVDQDHLKAAGVEIAYSEMTVTRRVFRDGGSEYFINRTPCRLKDIQQLFMGTGVGRASYSIMAQGNITQILSSKPEDRRMVFEEAAGITKFKSQKREALRKLEHTDQNLLRVSDLIREVKRQIGSLQRQAGKARRYKQLSVELQHLDTQFARHQFDLRQSQIVQAQSRLEETRRSLEANSAEVIQSENEIAQLRDRLTELEHRISETQQRGLELRNQAERHEHRIDYNQERLHEIEGQQGQALNEIAQADERRAVTAQELASTQERMAASQRQVEQHQSVLQERESSVRDIETRLTRRQETLRELQGELFSAAQQLARLRNEINALDLQKQGNLVRLDKLSTEKIQLEEERSQAEIRLGEFTTNVEVEKRNVETCRLSVAERQEKMTHLQERIEVIDRELDRLGQEQAAQRSRLTVLQQLQTEHEGFGAGTLAALKQTDLALGSLADRIRVPDAYVVAIETALGHYLQLVLTEQPESACRILEHLQTEKKGRASIVPLGWSAESPAPEASPDSSVGRRALDVIEADASVQPILGRLLEKMVIVDDLATATQAHQNGGGGLDYVTLSGELLSRTGIFTGGASNGNSSGGAPSSVLGRKNQITELESSLANLAERLGTASREKGGLLSERTALQAALHTDQDELRAQEVAVAAHEGEVGALQNSLRLLQQKVETVVYEVQSLAAQEEEGSQRRGELARQASEAAEKEQSLQQNLEALNAETETLREQRETAKTAWNETRVALATEEQVSSALLQQQRPLEARITELDQLSQKRRQEIESFLQRKAQAESQIVESRQAVDSLQHEREQISQQTTALTGERDALESDIEGREGQLRDRRHSLTGLQDQRSALDVELAQHQMSIENLRERIQQKYQLRLDDIQSECITITIADQGPPKVKTLTPDEMAEAGVSTDWDAVAEQVTALQEKLDSMGPVNLVAIEEYEETEQRYQFLTQQHDDLVQAKAQLHEVINRINTQTREMFTETFTKIRDNFRSMFTEVFDGGKADLRLVNEGDVLESGIEIVARPPGKQLQTISLLSGGEQTMTAVSLLFAIYQVRPSPFCVLDELDAPLDESNINRFVRILQRFLENSQFIIITHNKRTIGMADVLYGVTMEEQGISKIVSVRFHKSPEGGSEGSGPPLVPSPAKSQTVEEEEDAPHRREDTFDVVLAK